MQTYLVLDVETTINNKGNPFDLTNKLVMVGTKTPNSHPVTIDWEGTKLDVECLQQNINTASILVGFNIKFDLHWLRKAGIDISNVRVWDCQVAEYLLNYQKTPYPSLDQAAEKYGFEKKIDKIKLEYWDKGINTDAIPKDELSAYLAQDLILTEQVYKRQCELFANEARGLFPLFRIQCQDLLVLQEMEWNGIKFATEEAAKKAGEIDEQLDDIVKQLETFTNGVPINFNSNDHVSCLLYGGTILVDSRIPIGVYKTGAKVGQTRYKIVQKAYELPRLCEPLKGTEVKDKEGYWLVNETVLRKLKLSKEAKHVVGLLNKYSELIKLKDTYLLGYGSLIEKMNWPKDMLHGTLNQCVAVTGRLSSTKPNLQNAGPVTKVYMRSRY